MRIASWVSSLLTLIGALNWGSVGAARFDLVRRLFGRNSTVSRIVYGLVGVAGLVQVVMMTLGAVRNRRMPALG